LAYVAEAIVFACWCRQDCIEHVHAHFGTNSAAIAMLTWRISGIPYSFTVHGPEEFDKASLIGLAEKIRHSAFVVAISSYGRSQLYRWAAPKYWRKIRVIHCGLEPKAFDAARKFTTLARRFVCVGRLSQQKGHLLLLEAARRLVMRGENFELVLVGDGEMRADIEALIARYELQDKVRISGWLDSPHVRDEISGARALVLPSFAEGLPVVIMEAMALSRPVISTFVAGIPELVHSGEHGWLVPAGDAEALTDAMRSCLHASAETLMQMGQAAQNRALSRHNVTTEATKLANLFKSLSNKG
jgi:glycosyltransferase involved in cell wall biosynthesis